jgi:hypothetical protein
MQGFVNQSCEAVLPIVVKNGKLLKSETSSSATLPVPSVKNLVSVGLLSTSAICGISTLTLATWENTTRCVAN